MNVWLSFFPCFLWFIIIIIIVYNFIIYIVPKWSYIFLCLKIIIKTTMCNVHRYLLFLIGIFINWQLYYLLLYIFIFNWKQQSKNIFENKSQIINGIHVREKINNRWFITTDLSKNKNVNYTMRKMSGMDKLCAR